jgi:thioredoxin-related protein
MTRRQLRQKPLLINVFCILAWLLAPSALAQTLTSATDLAADALLARTAHEPVLVFFSEASCPWCERVRREYLLPMQGDAAYRGRVLIREIDTGSDAALKDFSGHATSQKDFARRFNVHKVPVLALFGPDGELLTEPMVGMALPDFYQGYIDDAIDTGRRKLGAPVH